MTALSHQRCFNHSEREAAARCMSCERHFCRECVTPHEGLMICGECLEKQKENNRKSKRSKSPAALIALWPLSLALLWLILATIGSLLTRVPSTFHDGGGGTP